MSKQASVLRWSQPCITVDVGPVLYEALRRHKKTTEGEVEEHETHAGLRAQTAPPPGERPGILAEPGPQRSDRTVQRSAGDGLPTPGLLVLAGASGEAVDASTLRFLAAAALYSRKLEEEEERKREEEEEELKRIRNIPVNQLTPLQRQKLASWIKKEKEKEKEKAKAAVGVLPSTSSSSSGFIRKRKKKRRKRTRRRC